MKKLLVTCALPYANGPIHIGHLVEYIQADIWVRYWRLRARDVVYFCADDTHGTPIMLRALAEETTPEELIERVWHEHRRDFAGFGIEFDLYHSTHSPENRELSEEMYRSLAANGHIVTRDIEQAYCPNDAMFLPDRYIRGKCPNCGANDQYGDSCEVCSRTYTPRDLIAPYCALCHSAPEWRKSTHLFFRLSDFTDRLRSWLSSGRVQEEVSNKLQEWFAAGLQDWDISRDAPYFGFEIPDYPGKYFYVWLDAPVGYMATTLAWCRARDADFNSYWRHTDEADVVHIIGKDITYFHALFWPATLMGSGFRTPTELAVHGFLTVDGEKMSKTRGTFINASTYLEHLDPQYLRYYYAAKLNSRVEDLDLNFDDFVQRVNSDLVGKLANIPSRTMAVLHKSCGGRLGRLDAAGRALVTRVRQRCNAVGELYEQREFNQVVRQIAEMADEVNFYLQERAPWQVAKENAAAAAATCTAALNVFRILTTLLQPILPDWGRAVARMLGIPSLTWDRLAEDLEDRPVQPYERLVDRVDPARVKALVDASKETLKPSTSSSEVPEVSLEPLVASEFAALQVIAVEAPTSGKPGYLRLRLEEDNSERVVIARIGDPHEFQHLVGQRVIVLVNLRAKTIQGEKSQGMILATGTEDSAIPMIVRETGE
jgi:methionyl-tRNA synthetase